jgi:hypothetical protein
VNIGIVQSSRQVSSIELDLYASHQGFDLVEITMLKIVIATAALLGATAVAAAGPSRFAGAELLPQAKITLAQARQTAVRAHPGVITDQELEKERGGTGLRYSFDIKAKGKTFEVGVDARTGKVLENDAEGANPD